MCRPALDFGGPKIDPPPRCSMSGRSTRMVQASGSMSPGRTCNAGYGEVTPDRVNSRNGYRRREWDTRAGTIELAIAKLRQGSYFPGFLEHRRRAERALASVVATSYLLGVSARRVEKLAASLGVTGLSKSQVSVMAAELDELVEGFRSRPLDRGPYTFCWIDALTQKVREGGRTVNVHCLIATGVNADGCREILGIDVTSSEDGAGWLAFPRGLAARGLSGVQLVTSDDHAGLVSAIAAVLPGAAWQRCRTHYHRNLLTRVPKSAQPWVSTLVRTIFEQPDPASVCAQHARSQRRWRPSSRPRRPVSMTPARTSWPSRPSPVRCGGRSGATTRSGAAEQGGPPPHRRGRHLPRPRRHHPAGRRGAGRAERRMDRVPPVYGPGNPRRLPEGNPGRYGTECN